MGWTRRNPAVVMLMTGVVIAAVSGVVLHNTWQTAQILVFTDSLYGLSSSPWTGGVITSIVFLAIGALLVFVGLIGVVVREATNPKQT